MKKFLDWCDRVDEKIDSKIESWTNWMEKKCTTKGEVIIKYLVIFGAVVCFIAIIGLVEGNM